MKARIYKPSRTAMQSGRGKISDWILEYDGSAEKRPEPLMGWISSDSTASQVRLHFQSAEDAIEYAERAGMEYILQPSHDRKVKPRNYGDNFKYDPPPEEQKSAKKKTAKKPRTKNTKKLEKKAQSA